MVLEFSQKYNKQISFENYVFAKCLRGAGIYILQSNVNDVWLANFTKFEIKSLFT